MLRRIADRIKQRGVQRNADFMMKAYNVVVVYIGMYLKYVKFFPWNVFDIFLQICLIIR